MRIEFTLDAWEDFSYWLETDPSMALRIKELLRSVIQSPFTGLGKPEPLKHELSGCWSRRISHEHRLVYMVKGKPGDDQRVIVLQCRFHYSR